MFEELFNKNTCKKLLPPERTNEFFEALFGDAEEGSYDIELQFGGATERQVQFDLLLHERPGHCLACNLTQGLPQVFSRHPLLNINGIVGEISEIIKDQAITGEWTLGFTQQRSSSLHVIPLTIEIK